MSTAALGCVIVSSALFGIEVFAYSVMSNHLHLVLRNRPDRVSQWSDREVAERWCRVCPGKAGEGLSIQMTVQHGPVTLLSVVQRGDGSVLLQVAEGESVDGPILQIGNTNSRYKFSLSAKQFMNDWSKGGPAHHCAIGVGHIGDKLGKLGALLGVEVTKVC